MRTCAPEAVATIVLWKSAAPVPRKHVAASIGKTDYGRANAVRERLKMRDMNLPHQFARVEIAGHENAGPTCRSGKCKT